MKRFTFLLWLVSLVSLTGCITTVATSVSSGISADPAKHWTADNGNGTYTNPLFYEEFEDPDVIRVGQDYYLAGTTMHMNPALIVMHSKDLVNWEIASYCMDRLDLGPEYRLEGGNIYGRGTWAPCIRYHEGMFYVFTNVNNAGLQVFRSKSAFGPWERNQLPGRHDLSVLFDDDGKIYLICGNRSPYTIEELAPDVKSFVPGAKHQLVLPPDQRSGEGHHLYKINGKYVDVMAIPGSNTDQIVATADSIDGPWRSDLMVDGENFGVPSQPPLRPGTNIRPNDKNYTLHQGGIVDTPNGDWWAIIMADRGSIGRMVNLVPVTWDNGLPYVGLPGNLRKAPNTWIKPNTGHTQDPKPAFVHDDNFDSGKLNPEWQWNHVPDDSKWSLTEKPGVLRLHSLPADDYYNARNSICQRPPGPESTFTVELDTSGMAEGDTAGLALLNSPYAWIGVVKSADGLTVQQLNAPQQRRGGFGRRGGAAATPEPVAQPTFSSDIPPAKLWLRVNCNFDTDYAVFSYSVDGKEFKPLGEPYTMRYNWQATFQGVRPSLFHFNTSGQPGGYVDFDNWTVDEPRARAAERIVPVGQTIALFSGADGSFLAADSQSGKLVNIAAGTDGEVPGNARFEIIDLGLGRVALKTVNGEFVSVASPESVVLKDLARAKIGEAESFQWVTLMRGDIVLMSLTNHKYLNTQPNNPGQVTVTTAGPRPDRKGGAEFKWKEVE
jgi:xylan 1,4-beta-xylosidase